MFLNTTIFLTILNYNLANNHNDNSQIINKNDGIDNKSDIVNVTFYYETMCPYCRRYFVETLSPTWIQLKDHMKLLLVPYGNAQTKEVNGTTVFVCPHGPKECHGNIIHGCTNFLASKNLTMRFLLELHKINDKFDDDDSVTKCGKTLNEDRLAYNILLCANSNIGVEILKLYGKDTKAANIQEIPTISLNESIKNQDDIQKDLFEKICKLLNKPPEICNKVLNK